MNIRKFMIMLGAATVMAGISSCSGSNQKADEATEAPATEATEAAAPAANPVIELAKGATITPAEGKGVVIDFNATWCGPCKKFGPHFEAVAAANQAKADFYSVDVDIHPELAAQYGVQSIPMVAYIAPDGKVNTTVGYLDEAQFAEAVARFIP